MARYLGDKLIASVGDSIEPLSQEEYDRRKEAGELEEDKYYSTPNDVSLEILSALYPVGSLYITTNNTCPLQSLGIGTWILEAVDRVLQGAGTRVSVGTTVDESLPNITGETGLSEQVGITISKVPQSGAFSAKAGMPTHKPGAGTSGDSGLITFDASRSSSTYKDNAPVQQNAYLINVYRRIS